MRTDEGVWLLITIAVRESLGVYDRDNEVLSFCGAARQVGSYYVVPVIQIPGSVFQKFPPLQLPTTDDEYVPKGDQSLIHSAIAVLLEEASKALLAAEPGRAMVSAMRSATEIVSEAADRFMNIPDFRQKRFLRIAGLISSRVSQVSPYIPCTLTVPFPS